MARKLEPEKAEPLRLEWRSPAELAENPLNWRTHPPAQVQALTDVLGEVGWAGACLYNERTGRLIDGHARRKVAMDQGSERVPVLVGSWSEEQEAKILATLDPLAAMAEADAAKLDALLRDVSTGSEALSQMIAELTERQGMYDVAEAGLPTLPDGDKQPFQQMTFTLADAQAGRVKAALEAAKQGGDFGDTGNENSNGNALARIAEAYLGNG
jgi:hypothetical protein